MSKIMRRLFGRNERFIAFIVIAQVVGEGAAMVFQFFWSTAVGATFMVCSMMTLCIKFSDMAIYGGSHPQLFSWVAVLAIILQCVWIWRFLLAINHPRHNCSVLETD